MNEENYTDVVEDMPESVPESDTGNNEDIEETTPETTPEDTPDVPVESAVTDESETTTEELETTTEETTTEEITTEEETTTESVSGNNNALYGASTGIESYTEVPFLEKDINQYNTTEGLLLCIFLVLVVFVVFNLFFDRKV